MSSPAVVVLGDVMVDVVTAMSGPLAVGSDTPATVTLHGGGSGANVASWLGRGTHWPVVFVGAVGDDVAGRSSAESLAGCEVDPRLAVVADRSTGTCVVLVTPDGERSMLPDAGANDGLRPEHLPVAEFRPGRHLHVTGYSLLRPGSRDAALAALDLAAEMRMTVSLDPSSEALMVAAGLDQVRAWCARATVLLANADEARVLTGEADVRRSAAALSELVPEAVVKAGRSGAVWHGGFVSASAPALTVDVVDTVGAGDAFAAGFLASWLAHPEPETALAAGNRLAADCVSRVGGRP
jgi:sugar/nucleoside kinase (ribokinase family)